MARPRSDISERIVRAARARFLAQGVDGASLREIAKDAGTSTGMVSYYFPSKDALFLAVLEEVYPRILADVRHALEQKGETRARIARAYARLHAASDEEFAVIRILLREALVSSTRLHKLFERFTKEGAHVPMMLQLLGEGMEQGAVRSDVPPAALLVAVMSMGIAPVIVRRLASTLGFARALPPADEAAELVSRVLFEGIAASRRSASGSGAASSRSSRASRSSRRR